MAVSNGYFGHASTAFRTSSQEPCEGVLHYFMNSMGAHTQLNVHVCVGSIVGKFKFKHPDLENIGYQTVTGDLPLVWLVICQMSFSRRVLLPGALY